MQKQAKSIIGLIVIVALAFITYSILVMPDRRTTGERIGDAIDALPQGVDKAAQQLEKRTPGEKLGDAIQDVGDDIKQETDRN